MTRGGIRCGWPFHFISTTAMDDAAIEAGLSYVYTADPPRNPEELAGVITRGRTAPRTSQTPRTKVPMASLWWLWQATPTTAARMSIRTASSASRSTECWCSCVKPT